MFFFEETEKRKYIPRTCVIDTDPSTIDVITSSKMKNLFPSDYHCFGDSGFGNNYARGEGHELVDEAMDIIRRRAESCNCPQGFQLMHSIGGGTGSGLGTSLLIKIRDEYPGRLTSTF